MKAFESQTHLQHRVIVLCIALGIAISWWACGPTVTENPEKTTEAPTEQTQGNEATVQEASGQDKADPDAGPVDTGPVDTAPEQTTTPDPGTKPEPGPPDTVVAETKADNAAPTQTVFGGNRPATLTVPPNYDHSKPHPLVILLHGYGATGAVQSFYFGIARLANDEGVLVIAPDGKKDPTGKQFWNATPACCDFGNSGVDDVVYLRGLVQEINKVYNVDPKMIYFIGHSNGGFMSHRMACEASDMIAGIVSLAGATFFDPTKCKPTNKISILQIHGTNDTTIRYDGGANGTQKYPAAKVTVAQWGTLNQCSGQLKDTGVKKDLESKLPGDETTIESIEQCPAGIDVSLWSIIDGSHVPALTDNYIKDAWTWMKTHPKP